MNEIRVSGKLASDPRVSPDGLATRVELDFTFRKNSIVRIYATGAAASFLAGLQRGDEIKLSGSLMVSEGNLEIRATYIDYYFHDPRKREREVTSAYYGGK